MEGVIKLLAGRLSAGFKRQLGGGGGYNDQKLNRERRLLIEFSRYPSDTFNRSTISTQSIFGVEFFLLLLTKVPVIYLVFKWDSWLMHTCEKGGMAGM